MMKYTKISAVLTSIFSFLGMSSSSHAFTKHALREKEVKPQISDERQMEDYNDVHKETDNFHKRKAEIARERNGMFGKKEQKEIVEGPQYKNNMYRAPNEYRPLPKNLTGEVNIDKGQIQDWEAKHHAIPDVKNLDQVNRMLNDQGYVAFVMPITQNKVVMIEGPEKFVLGHFENDRSNNFLAEFVPINQSVLKWDQFFSVQKRPYLGSLEEFYAYTVGSLTKRLPKDQLRDVQIEKVQMGETGQDAIAFVVDFPSMFALKRDMYMFKAVRGPGYLIVIKYATHYYNEHQPGFVRANQLKWRARAIDAINAIHISG